MLLDRRKWLLILSLILAPAPLAASERDRPGDFDYYTLVLSWSPTYCHVEGKKHHDRQCFDGDTPAFTLHGLWPQFTSGWPEGCRTEFRPYVPQDVIEEMADIMPSKGLVIHEYRAHGTCSGLKPAQYFAVARDLYERINIPARFAHADAKLTLSPEEIESDFIAANPWLKSDSVAITCRDGQLLDIRVCFGRDLFPRACGVNEDERKLCKLDKVLVPSAGR
jgi:ribonuclease T2